MTGSQHYRKGMGYLDDAETIVANQDTADYTAASTLAQIANAHFAAAVAVPSEPIDVYVRGGR